MLQFACLIWVGIKLGAPTWYFILCGSGVVITFLDLLVKIYNLGKES